MQGALREVPLSATVESVCCHTGRSLTLHVGSDGSASVREAGARPFFSVPLLNLRGLKDPSIVDRF